jgi:Smg protein
MFEILVYLYESFRHAELAPDRDSLERRLFAAGFLEDDIESALDWLTRMTASETHPRLAETTLDVRLYSAEELERLDLDCLRELRFLEQAEILDPESREWVISGLVSLVGEEIEPEQVRWMTLIVLWSRGLIEHFTVLESLLLADPEQRLH